ncbi:MAG: lipopolysaccharide kinase InaA family protein [Candidatus Tritonobacter lacicola]|nr:lipopolysaccharide kinase InaA family protein [Candidatus Tritonobacter lacicola]
MSGSPVGLNDILVDPEFREALVSSGLSGSAEIMAFAGGELLTYKGKRDRSVVKLALADGRAVFLKRYYTVPVKRKMIARASRPQASAEASREREAIGLFRKNGLPTVRIVATGESFNMTEEIEGSISLEEYVAKRFSPPLDREAIDEKRRIIRELALLTRKMHKASLSHKDYYLGHIFVRPDDLSFFVLDLQRVDSRLRWGDRWAVKDIAALDFSALPEFVSPADRMRFFKVYWGTDRLDGAAKRFMRRVLRKREKIARHTEKLLARREEKEK